MTTPNANAVPAGHSAYEVSQGGHSGVPSLLPATIPSKIPYEDENYKWDYDDKGVICRYDKETGEWEPMEPYCVDCGHRDDECDCCCWCREECYGKKRVCLTDICDNIICEDCAEGCEYCPDCDEEKEGEFPAQGKCGRCGEDNGKGGTELWCDLCEDCEEH